MKNPSSHLKARILGAIDLAPGDTQEQRLKAVAEMTFMDEDGHPRQFTWRTIQTWWWYYRKHGVTHLETTPRKDQGTHRKLSPEDLLEIIEQVLPMFRKGHYNKTEIYRACIEKGLFGDRVISRSTFYHMISHHELMKKGELNPRLREAWGKRFANQLWQADTMFGVHIPHKGKSIQTKLIAFIDDASRVVPHAQYFLNETVEEFIQTFKTALYKRGLPEQLYVDNGSVYVSKETQLICSRLGCLLSHSRVREPQGKGKIERFFRTVQDNFQCRQLDLSSLDRLNRQFTEWLEDHYNGKVHSTIGMKPIDRFGLDLKRIRFLPPSDINDELFFFADTRTVKKDNTFSFDAKRWEAPVDLRNRVIEIRFERFKKNRVVVYYKNERAGEAKLLVPFWNDRVNPDRGEM